MKQGDKVVYIGNYRNHVCKFMSIKSEETVSIMLPNDEIMIVPRKYVYEYDDYIVNQLRTLSEEISKVRTRQGW